MDDRHEMWKEWVSLQPLMDKIPQQFQHGLVVDPLTLTCMDAYPDHLVLGTNVGLIYLVHLPSYNIIKLKCENAFLYVTSIAAVSSVDDMIAAGCSKGSITIFQVPLVSASKFTLSQDGKAFVNRSETKSPKRYTIHVQQRVITSLIWSKNSMKLFSGDAEGNVYLIEVDYEKSECTGRLLLQVDSRIVQLSYTHQKLAVSYLERCLLYDFRNQNKVVVGKKPRNPAGIFGCVFSSSLENPQEDILYCARPNGKIWSANSEGEVLFSYIHQKIPESSKIILIDSSQISPVYKKVEFGNLYDYKRSVLVSHTERCLIVLNVSSQKILAFCSDFPKICDVAVSGDNIFILDNHHKIVCLSPYKPSFGHEHKNRASSSRKSPLMSSANFPLQENLSFESLYDIKSKMPFLEKKLFDNITKFGETVASKISEIATPPIISGNKDEDVEGNRNGEFDHTPEEENSSSGAEVLESATLDAENDIEEKKTSFVVLPKEKKKPKKKLDISTPLDTPHDVHQVREFNSDSRTYEDFKDTIEENESLLAEVLNLSCLKMDHENKNEETEEDSYYEPESISNVSVPYLSCESPPSSNNLQGLHHNNISILSSPEKELCYGPPSGSSATHLSLNENVSLPCDAFAFKEETFASGLQSEVNTMPPPEELPWDWHRHHLPAKPETLIGYKNSVCITESKSLYFSDDFYLDNDKLSRWKRRRLQEPIKCFSSCEEELFVLTEQGSVFSVDWKDLTEPKSILFQDRNVVFISLDEDKLWTLSKNGKVYCRNLGDQNSSTVEISCLELRLKSIFCRSGVIWGVTNNGRIAYRIGVRPNVPFGLEWGIRLHPCRVKCIHLSDNGLGWMLDEGGNLYVTLYVSQSFPQGLDGKWWQVGMADYMFGNGNCEEMMKTTLTEEINYDKILMTSNDHFLWLSQY
ncbi:WD repeat-containing protein [Armadillidium nasatum]|uniref:WD repeat-containing protein n=1 Tax=Armadillidium nasatum TaxID=96803 RepID=A0A5N5SHW1_9CRUS|nr:WD repeat-containing protein [Armadillidium nasatum]